MVADTPVAALSTTTTTSTTEPYVSLSLWVSILIITYAHRISRLEKEKRMLDNILRSKKMTAEMVGEAYKLEEDLLKHGEDDEPSTAIQMDEEAEAQFRQEAMYVFLSLHSQTTNHPSD